MLWLLCHLSEYQSIRLKNLKRLSFKLNTIHQILKIKNKKISKHKFLLLKKTQLILHWFQTTIANHNDLWLKIKKKKKPRGNLFFKLFLLYFFFSFLFSFSYSFILNYSFIWHIFLNYFSWMFFILFSKE